MAKKTENAYTLSELTEILVCQLDRLQVWQTMNDQIFSNDNISDEKAENVLKAFRMLESTFESLIGKTISWNLGDEKFKGKSRVI